MSSRATPANTSAPQNPLLVDKADEQKLKSGPFSLLHEAVVKRISVLVHCRNNRKIFGRLRLYDRHMNLVLEGVEEIWSTVPRKGKGQAKARAVTKHRFIPKMVVRGDSVVLVVKAPQAASTATAPKQEASGVPAVAADTPMVSPEE